MRQLNGGLSEILRRHICQCVRICRAAVLDCIYPILSVWNYDSEICKRDPCDQVHLNFQLWFQLFVHCLFQEHRILELWKNSWYSLIYQCWIIYSRLHKWIIVCFSSRLRQIQCRIASSSQVLKLAVRLGVRVGTGLEPSQRVLPHQQTELNRDPGSMAGSTFSHT